jgi:hypothetical protein
MEPIISGINGNGNITSPAPDGHITDEALVAVLLPGHHARSHAER